MKFYAKGVPKWSQNRCHNSSNINAKTGKEKDHETHKDPVSLNGKNIQLDLKTSVFKV